MASVDRAAVAWTIGIVAFAIGIAALGDELAGPPVTTDTAPAPQAPPETTDTMPTPQAPAEPAISANPVIASEIDSLEIPHDIASSNNDFAINFYRQISNNDDNIFFSPASVYTAFSVLYEGARENTASQIQDVFGLEPDETARHDSTAHMMASINRDDPHTTLDMANALWLADGFAPYDSYTDIVRGTYLADVQTVSFPDEGVKRINDWAAKKTNGTIDEVITPDDVDALTKMAITNAVYFKGAWVTEFPEEDTTKREFWTDSDQSVEADFMVLLSNFDYTSSDGAKVLKMPYKGDRLSMLVILPHERDGLAALEETISAQQVQRWLDSMRSREVVVIMPKFEMESDYDLNPHLKRLGVTDVFEPGAADLGGIVPAVPAGNLYVSGAIQKAYVKVSEEGTEASAVTYVPTMLEGLSSSDPIPFRADHPFLFTIYDEQSGMILFMGRVLDPVPRTPAEPAISVDPVMASEIDSAVILPETAYTNNAFAFDFYRQISDGGDNVFFSPASMYAAFSVLYEGARGNTASQIRDTFDFESNAPFRHNEMAHMMASINRDDPHATLDMANALWLADWFEPYDSYVDIARGVYLADTETVSFTDPDDSIKRINDWAANKTRDKIKKVLDDGDVNADTAMVITNAIYFNGTWVTEFPVEDTDKDDFWTGSNTSVETDFMNVRGMFNYTSSDGAQVLKMPYKGDRISMLVILPHERDGLAALEETISARQIDGWLGDLEEHEVIVSMPKFEMETQYNLNRPLVSLGASDVFSPAEADLGDIADIGGRNLFVSEATQVAYVKVDEVGTEAAAVTAIMTLEESLTIGSIPPRFTADHPFVFTIYDEQSGMVLFMGRVSDPTP